MSYLVQAQLASDTFILQRVTACVATEGVADPQGWVFRNQWQLSAQPGWVDAYKYAIDSGDENPGANEGAITDSMVLSAVQHLLRLGDEPTLPAPSPGDDEEY